MTYLTFPSNNHSKFISAMEYSIDKARRKNSFDSANIGQEILNEYKETGRILVQFHEISYITQLLYNFGRWGDSSLAADIELGRFTKY